MLATPVLLWLGQSLPAASAPAPGPHTSYHRAACADISVSVSLPGLLRNLFSHRLGVSWSEAQAPYLCRTVSFQPRGILDATYEPLYVIVHFADVAQRRVFGLFATPVSFRLTQSPLGAVLLPQALTSVVPISSPRGLSLAQARWRFPRLSSIPVPSRSSSRNPKL